MQTETTTMMGTGIKTLGYTVREAISDEQLDEVFKLRYKVFVEDSKYFNSEVFPNKKLNDQFDLHKGTVNLLARNNGKNIGTIRATIIDSPEQELPCDQYHEEYKTLRLKLKGKFSSVSMLAINKADCSVKLLYSLIKETIKLGNDKQVDYAFFPANYMLQLTLERLGAEMAGKAIYNEHIGCYVAPMMLDIKKIALRLGIKGYYC